jgi:putative membrane protein
MIDTVFNNLVSSLPAFLLQFLVALIVLVAGVIVFQWVTPWREVALINAGNRAAAVVFGSAVLGLALPLSICLAHSVNVADIVLWGVVAVVLQLAAFFTIEQVFRNLTRRIEDGDMAAAITLASTQLGVAMLNAAAVSG